MKWFGKIDAIASTSSGRPATAGSRAPVTCAVGIVEIDGAMSRGSSKLVSSSGTGHRSEEAARLERGDLYTDIGRAEPRWWTCRSVPEGALDGRSGWCLEGQVRRERGACRTTGGAPDDREQEPLDRVVELVFGDADRLEERM